MADKGAHGIVIFRTWDDSQQLVEVKEPFASLDELFAHCLPLSCEKLVDRIIIYGLDSEGKSRQLILVFESVTVS
ncbi:MAG: hypothetical protein SVX38_04525 [Chloroflexota bacterium]|nr:hypothetical protein [Chloroflexota bacterium]